MLLSKKYSTNLQIVKISIEIELIETFGNKNTSQHDLDCLLTNFIKILQLNTKKVHATDH